jgi:hypothetical protein
MAESGRRHSTGSRDQPCSRGDTLQKYVGRLPTESVDGVHSRGALRLHYNEQFSLSSLSGQSSTRSL